MLDKRANSVKICNVFLEPRKKRSYGWETAVVIILLFWKMHYKPDI